LEEDQDLEALFRHKGLRMLLARGRINRELIRMMESWRHSGFNVYAGPRIHPRQKRSLERLAAYLTRGASACAARPLILLSAEDGIQT
jgi:hypothetical protein